MKIPRLEKKPEVKSCHNTKWEDNYSWVHQKNIIEVLKDSSKLLPEVRKYLEEENAFTEHHLKDTKDIQKKYLNPPATTDFAILFLPTEGLYAEVLRTPGLIEELQNQQRIVISGPTTLAATLSSLRMGFRTLAIEKRSSEVWKVLSAVKTEFSKFGEALGKVRRQLDTASNSLEDLTITRTRAMERRLKSVETLSEEESEKLLDLQGEPNDD